MSTRPKRRGSLKGRGSALNLSRRHKVARSADALFQGIPNGLALRVKFIVIFAILSLFALCAWLNNWIGLPAYFLFLFALGLIRISFYLMGALGARFAPVVEGFLRVGRTTFRPSRFRAFLGIVTLLLLSYISWRFLFPILKVTSATRAIAAIAAIWIASLTWVRGIEVRYFRASGPAPGRKRAPTRDSTTAVVVVHGIGSKKPGGPLRSVANPVEQFLYRQAPQEVWVTRQPARGGEPEQVEFIYEKTVKGKRLKQRVVMTEVLWADVKHRPHRLKTIGWFLRSFPLMILLAVAPDHNDAARWYIRRIVYRLAYTFFIILSIMQPSVRPWALIFLLALALTTAFRRTNLLGDIQMASVDENEVVKIVHNINSVIDRALATASRVVVVAHSQGGYLSHRALQARALSSIAPARLELVGVGSGLKPIWLLREFSRRSFALTSTLLIGVTLVLLSLMPIPLGFLQWEKPWFQDWMPAAVRSLVIAPSFSAVHPVRVDWRQFLFLPWPGKYPLAPVPDLPQSIIFSMGLLLLFIARWKIAPRVKALQREALGRPIAIHRWTEISSPADTVGRLAFPRLSGADVYESPGFGNPLIDHISYFRLSSPATWFLSTILFPDVIGRVVPTLRQWAHYINYRFWRGRDFAATLGVMLLAVYTFDRLNPGARGIRVLAAQIRHPGWTFIAFLCLTATLPVLGVLDYYRFLLAVKTYPIGSPPGLKVISLRRRIVLFWIWFYFAAWAGASGRFLVRYSSMSGTEIRLLPIAPIVTTGIFFTLAAALLVGYRPSRWTWSCIVALGGYWFTYLPGRGATFMMYVIILAIVTGGLTALIYRRSSSIDLPDSYWPSSEWSTIVNATKRGRNARNAR